MRKGARTSRLLVCVLSSHPVVLEEFRRLLSTHAFRPRACLLQPGLASEEWNRLEVPTAPVYVVDAHAPTLATEGLIAMILERFPKTRVVVVAEKFSDANAFPYLHLGAKGLIRYADAGGQLARAVKAVAGGGFWVPRSLLSRFVDSILPSIRGRRLTRIPPSISRREREVLDGLLENLSNKELAGKLHISERTAKFHVSNLLTKFGVQRRADLILLYFQSRHAES